MSFFGHRYIDNFRRIEERVERQIRQLIVEHEFVEFLVGRGGDFDQIVSSAVIRAKKNIRDDNSALIWVLPYPSSELQNNNNEYEGIRYTVIIGSAEKYIYQDGSRWYVEPIPVGGDGSEKSIDV